MNTFKPDGWPTVTPRIFTDDVCLMELVEIRASQINGCAACLHMHTAAASAARARSAFTCSMPGANRRSTALANAPRSLGPRL